MPLQYRLRFVLLLGCAWSAAGAVGWAGTTVAETIDEVQPKIVKIYGAGGFRGMEAYQSGMLISPDGHVLTVFSHVLDTDYIAVTLNDGRRCEATLLGADPRLELALLKIEEGGLPYFELSDSVAVDQGARVLAFSNLYGVAMGNEPASVQHGVVSVKTELAARRGVFATPYQGPVYVLDAMTNNPGAAGGALVTRRGELVAMLGKEVRNARNNTWLNYAVPIDELIPSVAAIRAGQLPPEAADDTPRKPQRPLTLELLGIVTVPDVLARTPPYVDQVRTGSPAAKAGVQPDDLILMLDDRLIQSCRALRDELEMIDFEDPVKLTVLRGQQLYEVMAQVIVEDQ